MAKTKKTGTAIADWKAEMAKHAAAETEALPEAGGGRFISTQGGRLTFNGKPLSEPQRVVVLDWSLENSYFTKAFSADDFSLPDCFAIGKAKRPDLLMPDGDVAPSPQSDECASCWANEFGSAETGRGKACGQRVRLQVVSVDQLDAAAPDVLMIRVPPTRYDNFASYSAEVTRVLNRPLWGVATEIRMDYKKEGDAQKTPALSYSDLLADKQLARVMALREKHAGEVEQGYTKEQYEVQAQRQKDQPKRGARRKVSKKKAAKKARTRRRA